MKSLWALLKSTDFVKMKQQFIIHFFSLVVWDNSDWHKVVVLLISCRLKLNARVGADSVYYKHNLSCTLLDIVIMDRYFMYSNSCFHKLLVLLKYIILTDYPGCFLSVIWKITHNFSCILIDFKTLPGQWPFLSLIVPSVIQVCKAPPPAPGTALHRSEVPGALVLL